MNPYTKRVLRDLAPTLPDRVDSVIEHFTFEIAKAFLDDIQASAPEDIPGYPDMLIVNRIPIKQGEITHAFGVMAPGNAHQMRLRGTDAKVMAIWVRPKTHQGKQDPGAIVLARHNPWTMDTLPYEPKRLWASLIARKVTEREVGQIIGMKQAGREGVKRELADAGIKIPARVHAVLLTRRVSRDIAFEVLRREFGLTRPHVAHWRPALKRARSLHTTFWLKRMLRWVSVPSEKRWERPVVVKPGKASAAKRVVEFQNRIAGRGR
jgi:hypothetical protein